MIDLAFDLLVNGMVLGVFYAMMAVGLSLVFSILKVVNFAHGEYYMLGTYAYTYAAATLGWPLWVALPLAVIAGGVLGYLTERLLMRPLYANYSAWGSLHLRHEYPIIITFALSILLVSLADKAFGPYSFFGPTLVETKRVHIGPVILSGHRIAAFCMSAAVIAAVVCFMRFTYWGKVVQAVAQNRFGASLGGANIVRVSQIVFVASGALAALTGALLSPIVLAEPLAGSFPAIKSFVVIVLGGMGSIPGAIVGGLILGIVEMFAAVTIAADYRDSFGLIILVLVLLLRPQGLFGERAREV